MTHVNHLSISPLSHSHSMPLTIVEGDVLSNPAALLQRPEEYLVFYSDVENGQMWCGDCRRVQDIVRTAFEAADSPSAAIVFVGNKPTWKAPTHPFRAAPLGLTDVPTIIRLRAQADGIAKLVDADIDSPGLAAFLAKYREEGAA
ncbi:N-acetyltransferase domain-containing protein [Mycena indigotica]|uniref:N-acetyltransferase domain-containing protein n=1 Tax=Mycena indigotica TaxID=2126181 RepID=A0A8H6T0G7_9AGAR|nr:N-acetyltransferase domain-containing protein [Mycena indigotica]KAF7307210.1 N-acetyltransferase domain-containing protein [Mycena indigotica]